MIFSRSGQGARSRAARRAARREAAAREAAAQEAAAVAARVARAQRRLAQVGLLDHALDGPGVPPQRTPLPSRGRPNLS